MEIAGLYKSGNINCIGRKQQRSRVAIGDAKINRCRL